MGLTARELSPEDFWRIHYQLLNPARARQRLAAPEVAVRDDIWSEGTVRSLGDHVREYSEAEQLCHESLEDERSYFRQSDRFRRVMTLKVLPERATDYFASEPLLSLSLNRGGVREPVVGQNSIPAVEARKRSRSAVPIIAAIEVRPARGACHRRR